MAKKKLVSKETKLERVVPLLVVVIGKLLAAKGMSRYKNDLNEKIRAIMDGDVEENDDVEENEEEPKAVNRIKKRK